MNPFMQSKVSAHLVGVILFWFFLPGGFGQDSKTAVPDTTVLLPDSLTVAASSDSIPADSVSDTTASTITKDTVRYEADVIEYDIEKKVILMRSNGVVRYQNMTLYADTIHFLFAENMLVATGHPQLIEANDTVVGDHMVYNLKNGRGRVRYGTAHSEDSKYDGLQIARSDDKGFYIDNGSYTSCAVDDSSHYYFYGRHIKVKPGDKVISRPVVLNIAQAPVVALPYYITPLERGRQSGWLNPRWGGQITRGGHLDNIGYYFAPNDYTDYKISTKVTEFTSYVIQAQARYALRYWLSGYLNGRYSTSANHDTLNNLWAINYAHNQNLLPDESFKLSGAGNIVSGKSFYTSTSEDTTELLNQQINANGSLTKRFSKINAYSELKWSRNHNFKTNEVTQDLPSFSFNLSTRQLIPSAEETSTAADDEEDKEKWYNKIRYSYSFTGKQKYVQKAKDEPDETTKLHAGITHGIPISATQKVFKWFDISPFFNINQSVFDAYIDTSSFPDTGYLPIDTIVDINSIIDPSIPPELIDTIEVGDTLMMQYQTRIDTVIHQVHDTIYWGDNDYSLRQAQSYWWNTGLSLSTKLYGMFPIKLFNFTGLRHTFSPSVRYTLTPKKDVRYNYPGIGISHAARSENRSQKISFSAGNLFEGRALTRKRDTTDTENEKTFRMFTANISTAYDFEAKTRKWDPIGLSATIPNKLIDFSFSSSFTPYNDKNKLIVPKIMNYTINLNPKLKGASGSFWGGDFLILEDLQPKDYMKGYADLNTPGWSVNFNPSYSFSRSRSSPSQKYFTTTKTYNLSTSARVKFTNIWSVAWSSRYDFTKSEFMNHSLNFTCDLECWDLKFDWYPSGYNRGYYYFIVKIKKHPDIKWMERS